MMVRTGSSDSETAAQDINLVAFRQILIWPLAAAPTDSLPEEIGTLADRIEEPWYRVADPLRYLDAPDEPLPEQAYQEFVYFHGFVQRFLYTKSGALKLFKRDDIRTLKVCLTSDSEEPISLQVDRLHFYLFDIGVAMLVMETSFRRDQARSLTLADALTVTDYTRRSYPSYWLDDKPGGFPHRMVWIGSDEKPIAGDAHERKSQFIEHVNKNRSAPVAAHWRGLLPTSLKLDGYVRDGLRWCHVVDERMPTMTFIATNQVRDISYGDWARLCFVDPAGEPNSLPYAEAFLEGFEAKHAYDRFWDDSSRSRILISGYGFAMANAADEFGLKVLQTNFRRHYFQMGLALHFQTAALLTISNGLSNAVTERSPGDNRSEKSEKRFKERINKLRGEFLEFAHRYWFTGLSNHMQAGELYELWRDRLGLKAIYDEVGSEVRDADDYLQAKTEEENTEANMRLTQLAALGLPLALAIGFLGINVIIGREGGWTDPNSWNEILGVGAVFLFAGALLSGLLKTKLSIWGSLAVLGSFFLLLFLLLPYFL